MVGCLSKNLMRLSSHRRRQKKAALKSCQNLLRSFHNGSGDVNPFLMMQCPCVLQVTWCRHFLWQSETGAIGFVYHFAIQRSTGLCTETIWDLYIQIGATHVLIKQVLVVDQQDMLPGELAQWDPAGRKDDQQPVDAKSFRKSALNLSVVWQNITASLQGHCEFSGHVVTMESINLAKGCERWIKRRFDLGNQH